MFQNFYSHRINNGTTSFWRVYVVLIYTTRNVKKVPIWSPWSWGSFARKYSSSLLPSSFRRHIHYKVLCKYLGRGKHRIKTAIILPSWNAVNLCQDWEGRRPFSTALLLTRCQEMRKTFSIFFFLFFSFFDLPSTTIFISLHPWSLTGNSSPLLTV